MTTPDVLTVFPTTDSERVRFLAGVGVAQERIAEFVGVSGVTLQRRFARELRRGPGFVQARTLELLAQAASGQAPNVNVEACIAILARVPVGKGHHAKGAPVPPVVIPDGMGKKDAANVIAKVAETGTEWDGLLHDSQSDDASDDGDDEDEAPKRGRGRPRKVPA